MFRRAIAVVAILLLGSAPAFAKRVALVIGNGAYQNAVALPNPVNDAKAMSTKLRDLGFEVVAGYDQDYMSMRRTIGDFARVARGAEIALLFYAGHGMQVRGQNYLIPTDAKFEDETALDFETISMDFVVRQMSNDVRVRMVFLDACRDNPLARTLARRMSPSRSASIGTGLAEIKMDDGGGEGSVIAFATSPGDVALDGDGTNSPFTTALLKHIDTPDTPIQNVMTRVTGDVYRSTDERQRPWVNASLIGEVYLNKRSTAPAGQQVAALQSPTGSVEAKPEAPAATSTTPSANDVAWDREKTLFEFALQGGTVADYEAYLAAYPNGHFADIARNAIERVKASSQYVAVQPEATRDQAAATPTAVAPAGVKLSITDEIKTVPGTEATEAELGWDRAKRKEVQARLELAGFELGRPDGAFGPATRNAVRGWQTANGIVPTGFFTGAQYQVLASQTEVQYIAYEAEQRRIAAEAATRRATATRSTTSANGTSNSPDRTATRRQPAQNDNGSAFGAALIGGVVGGIIGGAIGR